MKSVLQTPAFHYLVLGGLLFAARSHLEESWSTVTKASGGRPRILITAAQREEIRREFQEKAGRLPTADDERAQIERAVDDEILYREAVARGLDRDNPVVRERVIQNMRLLSDDPQADESTLYEEGVRLGLDRRDVVVRRHLATAMRLLVVTPVRLEAPSDAELSEILEREADRYRLPRTTSVTHVFLRTERGRARAEHAAHDLLDELRAARVDPADAPERGDPFPLGFRLTQRTDADLDALFGAGFAAEVAGLPLESWGGPFSSSYGLHLVWVHARLPERQPSLESVRRRLVERVYHVRGQRRLHAWLTDQRTRYAIHLEDEFRESASALRPVSLPAHALSLPRPAAFLGD